MKKQPHDVHILTEYEYGNARGDVTKNVQILKAHGLQTPFSLTILISSK
jgi:hypothetical protein